MWGDKSHYQIQHFHFFVVCDVIRAVLHLKFKVMKFDQSASLSSTYISLEIRFNNNITETNSLLDVILRYLYHLINKGTIIFGNISLTNLIKFLKYDHTFSLKLTPSTLKGQKFRLESGKSQLQKTSGFLIPIK